MEWDGDEDDEDARYTCRYGPSRAYLCIIASLFMASPVVYMIVTDSFEWFDVAMLLAVSGGAAAFVVLVGLREARKRRLICQSARIWSLCRRLRYRTGDEVLADLVEIRVRYAEARELAEGFGAPDARGLEDAMRSLVDRLEWAYDARTGSLLHSDAGIAELAGNVRKFGMKVPDM